MDRILYDHFNEKLLRKIADYGVERMASDKKVLQNFNEALESNCVETYESSQNLPPDQKGWTQPGVQILGPKLRSNASELCLRLVLKIKKHTVHRSIYCIFRRLKSVNISNDVNKSNDLRTNETSKDIHDKFVI